MSNHFGHLVLSRWEIYEDKCYNFPIKNIKTIVDLGANLGVATVFFKQKFPNASVICVEPTKALHKYFKFNTKTLSKITLIDKPVFGVKTKLDLCGAKYSPSQYYIEGRGYETITMPELIKINNLKRIDLLKMDIEGGEFSVLGVNNSWLKLVDNLIVEIHGEHFNRDIFLELFKHGFRCMGLHRTVFWFKNTKS